MNTPDAHAALPVPNSAAEPKLIGTEGQVLANDWTLLADDVPVSPEGHQVLGFARALTELEGLNGLYGVRILPGDDVRQLAPLLSRIALIEVAFPGFRDGRGYSTARILREDMGYQGPLRAVGDVLRDQLLYMLRCGFDEFVIKDKDPQGALRSAALRFTTFYQGAADNRRPAWALRHG